MCAPPHKEKFRIRKIFIGLKDISCQFKDAMALMKQIKECLNKWKTAYVHGSEDWILLRWQYCSKWSTDSMRSQNSNDIFFPAETEKHPKIHAESQRNLNTQNNLGKEQKLGESYFLVSKLARKQ